MAITTSTPGVKEVPEMVQVLTDWLADAPSVRLHPGDVGWYCRFGVPHTAAALRTWSRAGEVMAIGLLDGPDELRLGFAPHALRDEALARRIARDAAAPRRGVLPAGTACVAAPPGALVRDLLAHDGWSDGESWAPLHRELTGSVPDAGVRIDVVGPEQAPERTAVQRSAFPGSTFTVDRWHAMADSAPYATARCLLARDEAGEPVAAATVWSAGEGRPGLIEPLGVRADRRGLGHGRAIARAAARALRELGASSAVVRTPMSNTAAIATYRSAGFGPLPEHTDLRREG
ncbi:GNAT family N-acetyltransferase [Streptomyces sp. NPDC060194]|uniref:GNAT family N-acetyltransferase n=1 Tax=Streptomyces sp. NPDC060194 TaxID=3347069 RepID=UPI003652CC4B